MKNIITEISKQRKDMARVMITQNNNYIRLDTCSKLSMCNRPYCPYCSKMAAASNYSHISGKLKDDDLLFFVTLTVKTVNYDQVRKTIDQGKKVIRKSLRKSLLKDSFKSIIKAEIDFVSESTVHPHFHVLLTDQKVALMLIDDWLTYMKDSKPIGQKIKEITTKTDKENIISYISKPMYKLYWENNDNEKIYNNIPFFLDAVFSLMNGVRKRSEEHTSELQSHYSK